MAKTDKPTGERHLKAKINQILSETKSMSSENKEALLRGISRYIATNKSGGMKIRGTSYTGYNGGFGADGLMQAPAMWYNPLIGSMDKYYFPSAQERQHTIWRSYYELDPIVGTGTDMFSELPWSDFSLSGIKDPTILHLYEDCINAINLPSLLPEMTKELVMKGKVIPNLIYSDKKGYWVHCMLHDPSYVAITGIGIAGMPPLLDLLPTPEMQNLVKSSDPRLVAQRNKIPVEVLQKIIAGKPIPLLDTNCTYIARKTCSYDVIGVSLYSRLFKIMMIEDALYNAYIAIARRNAAPLRIFQLGDPAAGWLPSEGDFDDFASKLEQAEFDPASTLIYHFGVKADYVGVSDKFLAISRDNEFLMTQKLIALGVPKDLLMGTSTFASSETGLQVMIERLASIRAKFVREWIIPKIFRTLAKAHGFYKVKKSEVFEKMKLGLEPISDSDLIIPKIRWNKSLEVKDRFMLELYKELRDKNLIGNSAYASFAAGIDLRDEVESLAVDAEINKRAKELLEESEPQKLTAKRDGKQLALKGSLVPNWPSTQSKYLVSGLL